MNFQPLEPRRLLSITPLAVEDERPERVTIPSDPAHLFATGNIVLFSADDGPHGRELWKSDGTEAGTVLVKDLVAGQAGSFPQGFALLNGTTYFVASSAANAQLWKTDGTSAGTTLVADLAGPSFDQHESSPPRLVSSGDTLFIAWSRSLHKSDGTADGTTLLKQFDVTTGVIPDLAVAGDTAYFVHYRGGGTDAQELWKSDGTIPGTVQVDDPTDGSTTSDRYLGLTPFAGRFYFIAGGDAFSTWNLWTTDGTTTTKITAAQLDISQPKGVKVIDNALYFVARDSAGERLWKLTSAAPTTIQSITPALNEIVFSFNGSGNTIFFSVFVPGEGRDLWKTDGTVAGTVMIKDIGATSSLHNFSMFDGEAYFDAVTNSVGEELWKTDGTAEGTVLVADINPGPDGSYTGGRYPRIPINNTLFFDATENIHSAELWKTDGSAAGTVMVKDINALDPPALDFDIHNGMLNVRGTVLDDTIVLTLSDDFLVVTRNGVEERYGLPEYGIGVRVVPEFGDDFVDASALPQAALDRIARFIVEAGDGDDTIIGTSDNDKIAGQAGNDSIIGGLGADQLAGDDGIDRIFGGGGKDRIFGGASRDLLYGQGGDDLLFGDGGNDHLHAGADINTLHGGAGNDLLISLNDTPDSLFGDRGRDTAYADIDDLVTGVESILA